MRSPLYSPDGTYFIARYPDLLDELRRAGDGRIVVAGLKDVNGVDYSSDVNYFVLDYGSSLPGELRRTSDGTVVANLPHPVASVRFSPDSRVGTFFINYFKEPGELRRTADGALVWSPDDNEQAVLNPDFSSFIVRHTQKPGELRRFADGSLIQTLTDVVDHLYFNSSATLFVVNYSSGFRAIVVPAELRRVDTGQIIDTLRTSVAKVYFSPDTECTYFVADYNVGVDALHSTKDGSIIASLSCQVRKVDFKPDAEVFVIDYMDGRSELWSGQDRPHIVTDLGLAKKGYYIDPGHKRLVLWYTDGRAYLLDLEWLQTMGGDPTNLVSEELVQLACQGLLSIGLLDKLALQEYIGDRALLSCQ